MIIEDTKRWFEVCFPVSAEYINVKNASVQLGVHFEEVAEMMESLGLNKEASSLHGLADRFKHRGFDASDLVLSVADRKALLDSLCDQMVTLIGVAHTFQLDIVEGLHRVNKSNFSKFEDGKPVYNEQGKVRKGKDYKPVDLSGLF